MLPESFIDKFLKLSIQVKVERVVIEQIVIGLYVIEFESANCNSADFDKQ